MQKKHHQQQEMELRFNNQQEVYNAIYSAVDQGLHEKELIPHVEMPEPKPAVQSTPESKPAVRSTPAKAAAKETVKETKKEVAKTVETAKRHWKTFITEEEKTRQLFISASIRIAIFSPARD